MPRTVSRASALCEWTQTTLLQCGRSVPFTQLQGRTAKQDRLRALAYCLEALSGGDYEELMKGFDEYGRESRGVAAQCRDIAATFRQNGASDATAFTAPCVGYSVSTSKGPSTPMTGFSVTQPWTGPCRATR